MTKNLNERIGLSTIKEQHFSLTVRQRTTFHCNRLDAPPEIID